MSLAYCLMLFFLFGSSSLEIKKFNAFQPKFEGDWIDTSVMFDVNEAISGSQGKGKSKEDSTDNPNTHEKNEKECACPACPVNEVIPEAEHCKMLDLILSTIIHRGISKHSEQTIYLKVSFTPAEFEIIQNFVDGSCLTNDTTTMVLLRILSTVDVQKQERFTEQLYKWFSAFPGHLSEATIGVIIATAISLMMFAWICHFSTSYWSVLRRVFSIIFVTSFCWSWMHMYQVKKAEKASRMQFDHSIPAECRHTNELSFMESIGIWFKNAFSMRRDPCVEYHKYYEVDTIWEVTPVLAISDSITRLVLHPVGLLGEYISTFARNLFLDLPVQLWLPVTLILSFFAFLLLMMYNNYRIRFPFFFATLEPTPNNNQQLVVRASTTEMITQNNPPDARQIGPVIDTRVPHACPNCRTSSIETIHTGDQSAKTSQSSIQTEAPAISKDSEGSAAEVKSNPAINLLKSPSDIDSRKSALYKEAKSNGEPCEKAKNTKEFNASCISNKPIADLDKTGSGDMLSVNNLLVSEDLEEFLVVEHEE